MWTLAVTFLFCVLHCGFACFAADRADKSACENAAKSGNPAPFAQKSAGEIYLETARKGLGVGAITIADLEWAAEQKRPVSPFRSLRDIGNLSVRDVLLQATRKIRAEDWPETVSEIRKLIAEVAKEGEQIRKAQEVTAPIWKAILLPNVLSVKDLPAHSDDFKFFTTQQEVKGFTAPLTAVHRLGSSDVVILRNHVMSDHQPEFFEMSDGRLFYSSFFHHALRVSDALSGELMLRLNLMDIKKYSALPVDLQEYKSILFESKNRLYVALVPYRETNDQEFGSTKSIFLVDVESKEMTEREIPNCYTKYERLGKDKLYAYGNDDSHVFIYDLIKGQDVPGSRAEMPAGLPLSYIFDLYADKNRNPRMLVGEAAGKIHKIFVIENGRLALVGKEGMFSEALHFADGTGRLWHANLSRDRDVPFLIEFGFFGGASSKIELKMSGEVNRVRHAHFVETPQGIKIFVEEESAPGSLVGYQVVDLKSGDAQFLPIAPKFEVINRGQPFFNPEKNGIFVYMGLAKAKWELFQLYGRENVGGNP